MTEREQRLLDIQELLRMVSGEDLNAAAENLIHNHIPWLLNEIARLEGECDGLAPSQPASSGASPPPSGRPNSTTSGTTADITWHEDSDA